MTHEMILVQGVWECLSCPRRIVLEQIQIQDQDQLRYQVLTEGEDVTHFGRQGEAPILNLTKEEK